jgi:hypothetical protein
MQETIGRMMTEAMAAPRADVQKGKRECAQDLDVGVTPAYADAVKRMKPRGRQAKAVFCLQKDLVSADYTILRGVTAGPIRPEDDPFIGHYPAPVDMEILYDVDRGFRKGVDLFIKGVPRSEALIGKESARRYDGFYGPRCAVDFAGIPQCSSNIVNPILRTIDIPLDHKQRILPSESWIMNTSYGGGGAFARAVEGGATPADAVKKEFRMLCPDCTLYGGE